MSLLGLPYQITTNWTENSRNLFIHSSGDQKSKNQGVSGTMLPSKGLGKNPSLFLS